MKIAAVGVDDKEIRCACAAILAKGRVARGGEDDTAIGQPDRVGVIIAGKELGQGAKLAEISLALVSKGQLAQPAAINIDHKEPPRTRVLHDAGGMITLGQTGKENLCAVIADIGGVDIDQVIGIRGRVAAVDQRAHGAIRLQDQ